MQVPFHIDTHAMGMCSDLNAKIDDAEVQLGVHLQTRIRGMHIKVEHQFQARHMHARDMLCFVLLPDDRRSRAHIH